MSDSATIDNGSVNAFLLQLALTAGTLAVFMTAFIILRPKKGLIYRPRIMLVPYVA